MGRPLLDSKLQVYTMKLLCTLLLVSVVYAAPQRPSDSIDGDDIHGALACTAGTDLGDKLASGLDSCSPATRTLGNRMVELMRNDCPSFEDIMQWVEEEYSDDGCVLQSIGWMDENFDFVNETIGADLMSLDPVVTSHMGDDNFPNCVDMAMQHMEDGAGECLGTFDEQEMDILVEVASKIAHYECFLHFFELGCRDFLMAP